MTVEIPAELATEIAECGFFPEVVSNTLRAALGAENITSFFVHHETTFDLDVVGRHLTALVLTPTRLIIGHTDETDLGEGLRAISSTESIALGRLRAVAVNQVIADPQNFQSQSQISEAWLTIGWGIAHRLDLPPAGCGDPACDSDHGYGGTLLADDLNIRTSSAGNGSDSVAKLIAFGTALQQMVGR